MFARWVTTNCTASLVLSARNNVSEKSKIILLSNCHWREKVTEIIFEKALLENYDLNSAADLSGTFFKFFSGPCKNIFFSSSWKIAILTQPPIYPKHVWNFYNGRQFIACNNDTGDNLSVNSSSPVSTTPAINAKLPVCPRNFVKIRNCPKEILKGPGRNWFTKKTWRRKSLVRLPLSYTAEMSSSCQHWCRALNTEGRAKDTVKIDVLCKFQIFNTNKILGKHSWGLRTSLMKGAHHIFSPVFCFKRRLL